MLPKINRLSLRSRHPQGRRLVGSLVNLEVFPNPEVSKATFAVVVSKKTAKLAVDRNKIKRQINEVIRPMLERVKPNTGVIIYAKPPILSAGFTQISDEIGKLFLENGLLAN